jgi:hypothetical protein
VSPGDVLKDYYFQTNKPLRCFKGQVIEVEPIWKQPRKHQIRLSDF